MRRSKAAALCVFISAYLLHVAGVMSYLVRDGRLSMVPIYDDVVYLIDGLGRLDVLDRLGITGFLVDYIYVNPPHAPFVALTSVLGLMFSAGAPWGPYLLNAAWVLIILLLGGLALRGTSLGVRVGILVAALAAPMFGSVLAEFRPDPVWGLMVGFAMLVAASTDVVGLRGQRLFALGLLIGAAVVSKPTAAPAAMLVLVAGLATQVGLSLLLSPAPPFRLVLRRGALLAFGVACMVVPYLVSNGAAILAYIRTVMSNESIWKTQATLWGHISYYLNRNTGTLMLGWTWFAAVPLLAICAVVLLRARDRRALPGFAGMVAALVTAYLIVTVSAVKSLMIGSILYGTIIATVLWCLGYLATRSGLRGGAALMFGILVFATQWTPRAGTIRHEDPAMMAADEANRAVLPPLLAVLRADPAATVLISVPGPAYSGTLDFLTRQQGVVRNFVPAYTWDTWELFAQGVAAADVVVLSEAGMTGQSLGYSFPSVQFQPRLLETLRGSLDFQGRPVYTDKDGRSVWLFVRKRHR